MSKFFELIKFLGQHWPGFCGEKNESHFPNFLKDANPLKSDEGPLREAEKKLISPLYTRSPNFCCKFNEGSFPFKMLPYAGRPSLANCKSRSCNNQINIK